MDGERHRPRLKKGVDLQLQSAYQENNWAVVARLAEKRAKVQNEQYFEILRICALSQLDAPASKVAGVVAARTYLADGTVVKDVDALELLEWACMNFGDEAGYRLVFGPLRARLVKAMPKDAAAAERCLMSCLIHGDLVSAQLIAASLDRSFPHQGRTLWWNILVTYLLSVSDQCPEGQRKIYSTLALKMVEKVARTIEEASISENDSGGQASKRSVQTEEETLLLYEITWIHGSETDLRALIRSSRFSPVRQFQLGRKDVFLKALHILGSKDWTQDIFNSCRDCLSEKDAAGTPLLLASDWAVWKLFIAAARKLGESETGAANAVYEILNVHLESGILPPVYRRTLELVRIEAAFQLAPGAGLDVESGVAHSYRMRELMKYIRGQCANVMCFEDVKAYVDLLDVSGLRLLASEWAPEVPDPDLDVRRTMERRVLACKLSYCITTCPRSMTSLPGRQRLWKCEVCEAERKHPNCAACHWRVTKTALEIYKDCTAKTDSNGSIRADLAILVAMASLRQAHTIEHKQDSRTLIQVATILEQQLAITPKDHRVLLLLVRLYLVLGCAARALELWNELQVKRAITNGLAPLFFDRISSISPSLLLGERDLQRMDPTVESFQDLTRLRMHKRLTDAFKEEKYGSALEISAYVNGLRTGCSRVVSLIERFRADRALGTKSAGLDFGFLSEEISDDTVLQEATDFGSFPNWESQFVTSIHSFLSLGPPPTNIRLHLAILAETYDQILSNKPPAGYKPGASPSLAAAQHAFFSETLQRLSNSFSRFLRHAAAVTTESELTYYQTLHMLVAFIGAATAEPPATAAAVLIVRATTSALALLGPPAVPPPADSGPAALLGVLRSLHALSYLRDAASAIKLAVAYVDVTHALSGDLIASADAALVRGTATVQWAEQQLAAPDMIEQLVRWIGASGEENGDGEVLDVMAGKPAEAVTMLVAGWRENMASWARLGPTGRTR